MGYYPVLNYIPSIAPQVFVKVYNQQGDGVALFDTWENLSANSIVNDVGDYSFAFQPTDDRWKLFELDGKFEIWRRIPGIDLDWYCEYVGLHRLWGADRTSDGKYLKVSKGVGLNDFLARTNIMYPSATIKSYKNAPGETCMKEYVNENCGPSAITDPGYEREVNGVLPGFTVQADTGAGAVWENDESGANLLDVLKNIAAASKIDYAVTNPSGINWYFVAYPLQLGADRTNVGLDHSTGLNAAGNKPVVFSVIRNNVSEMHYSYDRLSEANVCLVMGDGDGATRLLRVRTSAGITDSPWNRHEISLGQGGFQSQMDNAGDAFLADRAPKKRADFQPLQQPTSVYGSDYFLGDRITVHENDEDLHKRIISVSRTYANSRETLQFGFED